MKDYLLELPGSRGADDWQRPGFDSSAGRLLSKMHAPHLPLVKIADYRRVICTQLILNLKCQTMLPSVVLTHIPPHSIYQRMLTDVCRF